MKFCRLLPIAWLVAFAGALGAGAALAQDPPDPDSDFAPTLFEVLRAEPGGEEIVVGTAEPGALIELIDGEIVVGQAEVNLLGEWVLVPAKDFDPGAHSLAIRTTTADGRFQFVSERLLMLESPEPGVPQAPLQALDLGFDIGDFDVRITASGGAAATAIVVVDGPARVTVVPGDTLWDLAVRFYGDGTLFPTIVAANQSEIRNPRILRPGQTLIIPAARD